MQLHRTTISCSGQLTVLWFGLPFFLLPSDAAISNCLGWVASRGSSMHSIYPWYTTRDRCRHPPSARYARHPQLTHEVPGNFWHRARMASRNANKTNSRLSAKQRCGTGCVKGSWYHRVLSTLKLERSAQALKNILPCVSLFWGTWVGTYIVSGYIPTIADTKICMKIFSFVVW